jgi:hypothetical protein
VKLWLEENVEDGSERRNTVAEQPRADPAQERLWGQGIGNRVREFVATQRWLRGLGGGELAYAVHSLDASSFRSTHCDHRKVQERTLTAAEEQLWQKRRMDPLGLEECSGEVDERKDLGRAAVEEEVGRKLRIAVSAELRHD